MSKFVVFLIVLVVAGFIYYAYNHSLNLSIDSISKPTVRLIPSEMEEYGYFKILYKSCASLETAAQSRGVSNPEQLMCREACGKRSMDYSSYDCEKDLLVCYCIQ